MFQLDLALLENICVCAFLIDISFFNYLMSHLDMTNDLNGCVHLQSPHVNVVSAFTFSFISFSLVLLLCYRDELVWF